MKKWKKITLALAITLGILIVPYSANAATTEMTYYNISPLAWTETRTINKTSMDGQKIKVGYAFTPITDPCPNCEFDFQLYNVEMGKTEGGLRLKMNQTGAFPGDTDMPPGRYYLKIRRVGPTAVPSTVTFTWTY